MINQENPNHHSDNQPIGKEAGLDYTVYAPTKPLKAGNQQTINYLVHRMLWDQQDKIDLDDLDIGTAGTVDVEDKLS